LWSKKKLINLNKLFCTRYKECEMDSRKKLELGSEHNFEFGKGFRPPKKIKTVDDSSDEEARQPLRKNFNNDR